MAATIGPGGPFMAREIAIAGPPGPTVGGTSYFFYFLLLFSLQYRKFRVVDESEKVNED